MTYENLDTGTKAGPCRYEERGPRVEGRCGREIEIVDTPDGPRALVRTWLRQAYTVNECLGVDESGDRVCRVHGEVERYRRVRGRGDAILEEGAGQGGPGSMPRADGP